MPTFFCPKCWKEVEEGCKVCPHCNFSFESFDRLSYEEKMISALNHPVDEFKINAINVLGRIGGERAVKALEKFVERENSVPILLEVVKALKLMSSRVSGALDVLKKLENHRARVVAKSAKRARDEALRGT